MAFVQSRANFLRAAPSRELLENGIVEHGVVPCRDFQIERLGIADQQHAGHVGRVPVEVQMPRIDAQGVDAQAVEIRQVTIVAQRAAGDDAEIVDQPKGHQSEQRPPPPALAIRNGSDAGQQCHDVQDRKPEAVEAMGKQPPRKKNESPISRQHPNEPPRTATRQRQGGQRHE